MKQKLRDGGCRASFPKPRSGSFVLPIAGMLAGDFFGLLTTALVTEGGVV